jgi:hypothetical protein
LAPSDFSLSEALKERFVKRHGTTKEEHFEMFPIFGVRFGIGASSNISELDDERRKSHCHKWRIGLNSEVSYLISLLPCITFMDNVKTYEAPCVLDHIIDRFIREIRCG